MALADSARLISCRSRSWLCAPAASLELLLQRRPSAWNAPGRLPSAPTKASGGLTSGHSSRNRFRLVKTAQAKPSEGKEFLVAALFPAEASEQLAHRGPLP